MSRGLLNMCSRCAHSNSNTCIYLPALSAPALIDKQGIYSLYKVTPRRLPPPLVIAHFMRHGAGKCEVKSLCERMCVWMCCVRVRGVRMIQSAISLCEDSLHKHTRHAEDVVILRLIVCVSDVSNHHQTRGGFTLPLSLCFSAFSSDRTNCPIVLLLAHSRISSIALRSKGLT